jgi:non-specific protein-tyrosine kinase
MGKARRSTVETEEPLVAPGPTEASETAREMPPVRLLDPAKTGWVSPSYTRSRPVRLDPRVLAENRCVGYRDDDPDLEPYKVLRTKIQQRIGGGGVTVMVTSALPGEGKTLTAVNLALTFAKEFSTTVLLVDCDLKRQGIHEVLGFAGEKGVADYLIDDCPLEELFVWPGVEKLTVISGGKTVQESSELLGSPGMRELVQQMRDRYPERYVIFDVPPVLTSADALAFAPFVDQILVTVRAEKTPMQEVNKALALLPREKVMGLVMNRQRKTGGAAAGN